MPVHDLVRLRPGSAAWWKASNPTPADREPCYEVDKNRLKIGDGATAYVDLPYLERGNPAALGFDDVVEVTNGTTGQVDIEIPDTDEFESLVVAGLVRGLAGAGSTEAWLRFNDDTTAKYHWQLATGSSSSVAAASGREATSMRVGEVACSPGDEEYAGALMGPLVVNIPLHRKPTGYRTITSRSGFVRQAPAGAFIATHRFFGMWEGTADIVKVSLGIGGSWAPGSLFYCWGIRA